MAVAQSIMLYGAEVWADSFINHKYKNRMISVHRRYALRVASAYRTVSHAAILVIAGMISIDLLTKKGNV